MLRFEKSIFSATITRKLLFGQINDTVWFGYGMVGISSAAHSG